MKYGELFKLLNENGWYKIRQRGSHVVMQHSERIAQITVPYHPGKEVKKGMLSSILKNAGIITGKR